MDTHIAYDSKKDRTFYTNPSRQGTHIDIGNGIFTIMFPSDGHSPQHYLDEPQRIKIITVKVNIIA
jgi:biofilm protein TabA